MRTLLVFVCAFLAGTSLASECRNLKRTKNGESFYCVCDEKYCDEAPSVEKSEDELSFTLISSSKEGLRFSVFNGTFDDNPSSGQPAAKIQIDKTQTYQEIIGFGGSLTDAVAININALPNATQEKLIGAYFGNGSIEYSLLRMPMGSSDFSKRPYSYAMVDNDKDLNNFTLADEDTNLRIPLLKKFNSTSNQGLKLIASPWSPSPWMKTINDWTGKGELRREYYQTWADYFVKFFEAYKEKGFEFWGLTPQNEPVIAFTPIKLQTMGWNPKKQAEWISRYLAPALKDANLTDIKIIIGDGNNQLLPHWIGKILQDKQVMDLVSGIAVHWYLDSSGVVHRLEKTHKFYPDKFLLYTEASSGFNDVEKVKLGSWSRAEDYASSIINTLSHWVTGWIDWNLALNVKGGPNWEGIQSDAAIIVNATAGEFYKQPTYYAMGHFSKYVPAGSKRVKTEHKGDSSIKSIGFVTPDEATVLVFMNDCAKEKVVLLTDKLKGSVKLRLPANSIHSVVYW